MFFIVLVVIVAEIVHYQEKHFRYFLADILALIIHNHEYILYIRRHEE